MPRRARSKRASIVSLTGGLPFTQAADAIPAALKGYGVSGPIALVTPYYPVAAQHLLKYRGEIGFPVAAMCHLARPGPIAIAQTSLQSLRNAIAEVNLSEVVAIVQFGANLPMGRLPAAAETWLGKPVIAVNTATYWHALRSVGIMDRLPSFGRLLSEH